ncbi:protoporphyrinogen oxidase [Bacillus niameyensis]|uniref:protoporphyrinogen oxidase n=1 Tax=Bacillus niameyensis TaxID=1522308 RepID=UPI000780D15E|nr:protoporphyrinogen oxidase [Bacillus niameyensis]
MKTVMVLGGGITGLSAMYELHKWKKKSKSDIKLILVEGSTQLGGKIKTVKDENFIMEAGADSIVTRKANELNIMEELGIESEVVYNSTGRSFIYTEGKLKAIPADAVFGIPASIESLAKSTLVSPQGKVEALKDFYLKNDSFKKDDSIGDFLEYFLGKELVEKQIAPVLSGVYSGKLSHLSIASTLPYLLDYKEEYGSIIKGLEANKEKFQGTSEKKFISFQNGLGSIISSYEEQLENVDIYTNYEAEKIGKINNRYQVLFSNKEKMEADYIVLALPHSVTQKLLNEKSLDEQFSQLKTSSLISVYIGFDLPDHLLPEEGTGFITENTDELACNACTWTSRKWKHTSKKGNLLVRLFYKSSHPLFAALKGMSEEELLQAALQDIEKSLDIKAEPVTTLVTNWTDNMPNYQINHRQIVGHLEQNLASLYPQLLLAGCSYYGVGIPDCIQNGMEIAEKMIQLLNEGA